MKKSHKTALYAAAGLAVVGGGIYALSKQSPAASGTNLNTLNNPAGGYTPSNGTHNLTVPVGTTTVVNLPAGGTITAGNTSVASVGANTITGVAAGTTTVSIAWTPTGGVQQNDSVVVTVA